MSSPNNILGEALSGATYKCIYTTALINHTSNSLLLVLLICLWGDATHIDVAGRFTLKPQIFCPLIFKEKIQSNNKSLNMLRFVKHINTASAHKNQNQ